MGLGEGLVGVGNLVILFQNTFMSWPVVYQIIFIGVASYISFKIMQMLQCRDTNGNRNRV